MWMMLVRLFPTAYIQSKLQRVQICGTDYLRQVLEYVEVDRDDRLLSTSTDDQLH